MNQLQVDDGEARSEAVEKRKKKMRRKVIMERRRGIIKEAEQSCQTFCRVAPPEWVAAASGIIKKERKEKKRGLLFTEEY